MSAREPSSPQTRAELVLTLRRGESLIVTLAIPLGILVFFAKVDTIATDYKKPVDFLVPGVLALAVMSAAMVSLGIATGFERRYGVLKRLGSTPLSRGGLLVAKTATILLLEIVQAVAIIATGAALGWHVPAGVIAAASGCCCSARSRSPASGMLLAGTLRAEANLALANGLFLVLLFLGGMAYPLSKLPGPLEAFARLLPAAALSECVRGVLVAGPRASRPAASSCCWSWAVGAPVAAIRSFRWEE